MIKKLANRLNTCFNLFNFTNKERLTQTNISQIRIFIRETIFFIKIHQSIFAKVTKKRNKKSYLLSSYLFIFFIERRFFNHYNKLNSIKYALDLSIIQELSMFSINNLKTVKTIIQSKRSITRFNRLIIIIIKVKIKQFDCPPFHRDELKSSFGFLPPLIIEIGFMFTLLINLGYIVREKQNKMKVMNIFKIHLYSKYRSKFLFF